MPERVILVGLERSRASNRDVRQALAEASRLVETAQGSVLKEITQKISKPDPATLLGRGKAEEIGRAAQELQATTIVIDEDLSPAQQRNLEAITETKVIDRTRLILDIFARRARTREGILQVELAQLDYMLPRLSGKGTALMQQVGGIGTRGPGERKLEISQRRIRDRMARLRHQIESIRHQRMLQRQKRQKVPLPVAALVGYTNVGKSTLLNTLTLGPELNNLTNGEGVRPSRAPSPKGLVGDKVPGARQRAGGVYADDKLFATLDPTTRRVKLPNGSSALFTDTVGFINKLPTSLIAAFRATLEEVQRADCLIHVADASHPHWKEQMQTVEEILRQLHTTAIPQILVFNKADLLTPADQKALSRQGLVISAFSRQGLQEFLLAVQEVLSRNLCTEKITIPHDKIRLLHHLHETGQVLKERYNRRGVEVTVRLDEKNLGRILKKVANK